MAALVIVTIGARTNAAGAAPELGIRLTWKAPPECPSASEVVADARSLVVHREALARSGTITVDAVVVKGAANRWTLSIHVGDAGQQLHASSCADLARAGALLLALLMDPDRAAATAPGSTTPRETPTGTPPSADTSAPPAAAATRTSSPDEATKRTVALDATAPSTPAPAPAPALGSSASKPSEPTGGPPIDLAPQRPPRRNSQDLSGLLAAGAMVDVGTLPHARALGMLAGGIRVRRVDLILEGTIGPPQDSTTGGAPGGRFMAASGMVEPCYVPWLLPRVRIEPCLPVEVGWIHGQGMGVTQSLSSDAVWWSMGGALALWVAVADRFEARADFMALVPLVRPRFELSGGGSIFEPTFALRGGLAAAVRF